MLPRGTLNVYITYNLDYHILVKYINTLELYREQYLNGVFLQTGIILKKKRKPKLQSAR